MSRSEPGRRSLAGGSAGTAAGRNSARWTGAVGAAKAGAFGAVAAVGAAARPMAASKKAFCAAARAASAAAPAGEVGPGWTGKALGRIGVTGRGLDFMVNARPIWRAVDQRPVNIRAVRARASR